MNTPQACDLAQTLGSIPENRLMCPFRTRKYIFFIEVRDTDCLLHIRVLFIYVFPFRQRYSPIWV
jgi:hypothetical protein